MAQLPAAEMLGAHVSVQGGMASAPVRGVAIGASAIQVFTKTPNQWREPVVADDVARAFRDAFGSSGLARIVSHDSYLINLASPDPVLRARSEASFRAELERCRALGIPHLVSHPGNYIDDRAAGLARNAEAITRCLEAVPGNVGVLLTFVLQRDRAPSRDVACSLCAESDQRIDVRGTSRRKVRRQQSHGNQQDR